MAVRQQQRRGTASQWASANPILSAAEIGFEVDTNKFKIGDGTNRWEDLIYFTADAASAIQDLIDGAPGVLDTLNELAAAIGDDANFVTTVTSGLATKAPIASPTFTGTVSGVTKAHVGLGSVDNTTDANKPVSTAQATAIATAKSEAITSAGTAADTKVSNAVAGLNKSSVGLSNVDNTTDANKPVSTATQTALDLKAPKADPTFTGTVTGVTKSHVGLGNVDNTTDAGKPISTATQTALDLKLASATAASTYAPLVSPALTGTPTSPTASVGTDTTQVATTAFVKAAIQDISSLNLVLDGGGV
jgi:hypothetical protein